MTRIFTFLLEGEFQRKRAEIVDKYKRIFEKTKSQKTSNSPDRSTSSLDKIPRTSLLMSLKQMVHGSIPCHLTKVVPTTSATMSSPRTATCLWKMTVPSLALIVRCATMRMVTWRPFGWPWSMKDSSVSMRLLLSSRKESITIWPGKTCCGAVFSGVIKLHINSEHKMKNVESIYICSTQSWNFFHQLYNYSKKILYKTQQNIYI